MHGGSHRGGKSQAPKVCTPSTTTRQPVCGLWYDHFWSITEGAEDILYELAAVYSSAAPAAEDAEEDLTYFEQKLQLTLQRQVARMLMVVCPGYLAVAEALKRQYNLKCTFFNLLLLSTILEQQDTLQSSERVA